MWCHLLLLVPVILLGLFLFLPWTTALAIAAPVLGAAVLLVWCGWRALRRRAVTGLEALVGGQGEAATDLKPEGLVRLRGELWTAEAREPVARGGRIEGVGVRGTKVVVQPWG